MGIPAHDDPKPIGRMPMPLFPHPSLCALCVLCG